MSEKLHDLRISAKPSKDNKSIAINITSDKQIDVETLLQALGMFIKSLMDKYDISSDDLLAMTVPNPVISDGGEMIN